MFFLAVPPVGAYHSPIMIPDMHDAPDEFGRLMRRLRKDRGLSLSSLSQSVGLGRNYIGYWERDASIVPRREVLLHVVTALKLTDQEARELLRLADLRGSTEATRHLHHSAVDPDANLLEALLTIEHAWPSQPPTPHVRSERAQPLIDSAAWVLAHAAAVDTDILPAINIRWPDSLIQLGVVPKPATGIELIEIPEEILAEEMPFVGQLAEPVTREDAKTQSIAMARVYRRVFFWDTGRARAIAEHVERWDHDKSQALHNAVSFRFHTLGMHERHGFTDITTDRVISVARRSLAKNLWTMAGADWCCEADGADWYSLWSSVFTSTKLLTSYQLGDHIRDSVYAMRSPTWADVIAETMRSHNLTPGSEKQIEEQLYAGELSAESKDRIIQNAHRLACVDQTILIKRVRALEAMILPPDKWTLWKAGETKLILEDGGDPTTKRKPRRPRKSTAKKMPKAKTPKRTRKKR